MKRINKKINALRKRINALWAFTINLFAFLTFQIITQKKYLKMQEIEMLSDDNKYYTGKKLKKDNIEHNDYAMNYIDSKANERFRKKYEWRKEWRWQRKLKKFIFSYKHFCILPS